MKILAPLALAATLALGGDAAALTGGWTHTVGTPHVVKKVVKYKDHHGHVTKKVVKKKIVTRTVVRSRPVYAPRVVRPVRRLVVPRPVRVCRPYRYGGVRVSFGWNL